MKKKILFSAFIVLLLGISTYAYNASANHSWGVYHWARTANPLSLKLGDALTTSWDNYLSTTSSDWSLSNVLDTNIIPSNVNAKTCKPTPGQANICNSKYGRNGWLGIASIWANGAHITQGTVKMNDTYFNTPQYNTSAWKNLVMCQEVGHIFGLDHQDENFNNAPLGTCMDYSNDPVPNQHPNQHDYDMLETIYAHLDNTNTANQSLPNESFNSAEMTDEKDWGKEIKKASNGKTSLFEKDFGNGHRVFTFVYWAE